MEDLTGKRFGKLYVISRESCKGNPKWLCVCDCGVSCIKLGSCLRSGDTKSCGCIRKDLMTKHGMSGTLTYNSWSSMLSRICGSYQDPVNHKYYAGKDIDPRWIESFNNFLADMRERPSAEYTIDRIDGNLGYWKSNCRWADKTTQARNTKDKGSSGIYYRKDRDMWQAQITINGTNTYLGLFKTKEDALRKRKEAEQEYWCE